jgi:hypothetical protein
MNPFPRDGFNWVKNFQSRKICGDFLSQKEFHILFLATWETFEAHGASWSVHHQQTPLLLGIELVHIEMVARPRCKVASCWLVGKSLSSFTKRVGWHVPLKWSKSLIQLWKVCLYTYAQCELHTLETTFTCWWISWTSWILLQCFETERETDTWL